LAEEAPRDESVVKLLTLEETCSCGLSYAPVQARPWRIVSGRSSGHSLCSLCNAEGSVSGEDLWRLERQQELLEDLIGECIYDRCDALLDDHRQGNLVHLYGPGVRGRSLTCFPTNKRRAVEPLTPLMPTVSQREFWISCGGMAYIGKGVWRCMVCCDDGPFRECEHAGLSYHELMIISMVEEEGVYVEGIK
jgi:hypothetical protein